MNALSTFFWFIVAVSLLVTVHEFGHYWVARRLGFKVLRFSVGFGKPLYSRVAGADRTEYVLAAIPLGGYVKLLDEREGGVAPADLPRSFTRKPPWQRILVLLAGPAFNIAFAILLLWVMLWSSGVTDLKAVVGEVRVESPAARAGMEKGDEIVSIEGVDVQGQRGVVFGLLDAVSGSGHARIAVRDAEGRTQERLLAVTDATERRKLTEPALLFEGLGFQFERPPLPPVLGLVEEGGPAAVAGLAVGDRIVAVDGDRVEAFQDLVARISPRPGESITVTYERAGVESTVRLNVGEAEVEGRKIGRIRVAPAPAPYPESMIVHRDLSPLAALGQATVDAWDMTVLQARLFARMLMGQVSLKNLSGPLSIAEFAGESASAGVGAFAQFLVLISLSLGFLNLLPIPILDGGQILFQAVEWLKGRPLSERAQVLGQQVGIALLLLLMGVALFNDFARQFG